MITPSVLKAKAASRYRSTMQALLQGENPFPVRIAYKRPSRVGDPAAILRTKEVLRSQSKEVLGFGPTVEFENSTTRRFGQGALPGTICFETLEDLTHYIGKKAEAERTLQHAGLVVARFPEARLWSSKKAQMFSEGDTTRWQGIIRVVEYFLKNPKPWIYARELPLDLPTKFLERNYIPVVEILKQVSPGTLNESYSTWQDRLGLRSSSDLVEGRFLDPILAPHLPQHMMAPVKEWNRCEFIMPDWVLVTENRTNLLTLPALPRCLALLGKGYAVTRLAQIEKLHQVPVYYWGDIDQHGFEILASLRSRLSQTLSCLMDSETFGACSEFRGTEDVEPTLQQSFVAEHLNDEERGLWRQCSDGHLRLEQEHVPKALVAVALQNIVKRVSTNSSPFSQGGGA